ncbi:protein transport protein Sec16A [Bombina bombina]|uniref:protein transport protein Sec16A n=1 Tax=Bombina bombina TaxID=8345 RepID=UPI00235B021E|nr:protein transport protein Sec16A [Bombina bombina]
MQPPPQTGPPATGGPPRMGMSTNAYWRKRGPTPASVSSASVQPVTDPFAFGRLTPQNMPQSNVPQANLPAMPNPSPAYPQPPADHSSVAGDYLHGMQTSGPVPQPGAMYTPVSTPSAATGYFTNTPIHHSTDQGLGNHAVSLRQNASGGLENAFAPSSNRSQSRQGIPADYGASAPVTAPLSFVPTPSQQTTGQWGFTHAVPPTSVQNFPPSAHHSTYNASYSSPPYLEVSNLPPQASIFPNEAQREPPTQRTVPINYPIGSSENNVFQNSSSQLEYMHSHNPQQSNNWLHNPYKDQIPLSSSNLLQTSSQSAISEKAQDDSQKAAGRVDTDTDSGTISMFFKGDEAENVEILSTDRHLMIHKPEQSISDPYQSGGHHSLPSTSHPQQIITNVQSQTTATLCSSSSNQMFLSQNFSSPSDPQMSHNHDVYNIGDTSSDSGPGIDPQYDNVENVEYIQNQEVLPNELPNNGGSIFPTSTNQDAYRYGMLPGPSLPKNISNHTQVGPNLETPDALTRPVRSDSVSSNYSNLSQKSLPNSSRPQELAGTFIQKEKLDDMSTNFFKQVDSPMSGNSSVQGMGQNSFSGSHSQPPTPSPPKPMGIFQTSANSSFEPVRSHALCMKPQAEVSQGKVVADLQENQKTASNMPHSSVMPAVSPGNLEQPPDNLENIFSSKLNAPLSSSNSGSMFQNFGSVPLLRPSSRAHGSNKKCESPATTLWAQGEIPHFEGNVLLAPAAPVLYVPPKPQTEVIQPPEDGMSDVQSGKVEQAKVASSPEDQISSENLENPPKIGDEEPLHSQASSGYASLLSSPPTESLQNQPILIAPPNKSYNFSQPINFSMTLPIPNQMKYINSAKDTGGDKLCIMTDPPVVNTSKDTGPVSLTLPGPVSNTPVTFNPLSNHSLSLNDSFPNQPSNMSKSSLSNQVPLNLVTEIQKTVKVEGLPPLDSANKSTPPVSVTNTSTGNGNVMFPPPVNSVNTMARKNSLAGNAGALDFTVPRAPTNQGVNHAMSNQSHPPSAAPGIALQSINNQNLHPVQDNNKQSGFYQQVTKEVKQPLLENPQQTREYMAPGAQPVSLVSSTQIAAGNRPVPHAPQTEMQPPSTMQTSGAPPSISSESIPRYGLPEQLASTVPAPMNMNNATGYPEQARPPSSQTPKQGFPPTADPYYYYRGYGAYPPTYPQPYQTMDPRTAYYPDPYSSYDPLYRGYADSGKYPYQEPERPSSRSSQCSDRPSSRQGYSSKPDWSSQSNYYADYYQNHYNYGDPARWDRYPGAYDPGYRDSQTNYWGYAYGNAEDPYQQKASYNYPSRYNVYEDRWQYDPRYVGGFDDEIEPRRDMAKDDFDRRSVHSEHSAHSVHSSHSRRSSFSSHSQHSQIYNSQPGLPANVYDPQLPNPNVTDYTYSMYPNNYSTQQSLDPYSFGYTSNTEWQAEEPVPSRSLTPEKFGSPHVCARFGPGGHLIKVLPNLPSDGQPALVEIHNMEVMLQHCPEQEQLRTFPGPLVKDETHKVDVITFAHNKAKECLQNDNLIDQESVCLLWDFIVLLCRQNGTVVGTDIADLLLKDHKTVWLPGKSPNEANLIDFSNEPLEQEEESVASQLSFLTDTLPTIGNNLEKETERFRELLLFGRKKMIKHYRWNSNFSSVLKRTCSGPNVRFANSLPINDPLQTVYQLMSGRMPAAATCCGDEKWGDWRPHLAMVLSNLTNNLDVPSRTITTMGDTLASKGLLDAAHFCYLMAQVGFGVFTKKSTKLVLIGSNHSLPFLKFASNEAIQRTEAYEYAQSLGTQALSLPNIQVFKFIYACRLAEYGLSAQAFHYCEVIAKTVLKHPSFYSPVLVSQLLEVSSHLRFFDPQLKEKPEQELFIEPPWLLRLRHLDMQIKQGTVVFNPGRATPQQYTCSTPSSDQDHISQSEGAAPVQDFLPPNNDNPLLANLAPNMMPQVYGVQLALPGPENTTSVYQPPATTEPLYVPTQQPPVPTPGFPPQGPSSGFVPYTGEQSPTFPAPQVNAMAPPSPQTDAPALHEQWNPDPGLQRFPQNSPTKTTFPEQGLDFYGEMARMAPGQRSRTVSQSSAHMRRTRTTSESSTHSIGSGRRSSVGIQPSPPPPAIPEAEKPERKKEPKTQNQAGGRSWLPKTIGWLIGKGKNEAHLPDDRNKSIVWDETKQRWINNDEPEEESKPLPPPPPGILNRPQGTSSIAGGPPNPSVNMFSIRAGKGTSVISGGARGRYVDVLNPGGSRPSNSVPPPADLFAPLAPMPIPANLFVPNAVPEEEQPLEASGADTAQPTEQPGFDNAQTPFMNSASLPPGSDLTNSNQEDHQSGELSRSSSMSSLSREVSHHFNQDSSNLPPVSGPPVGTVQFYNPSHFTQQSASGMRPGRLGQRKYPTLK